MITLHTVDNNAYTFKQGFTVPDEKDIHRHDPDTLYILPGYLGFNNGQTRFIRIPWTQVKTLIEERKAGTDWLVDPGTS